jgi:outer membrane lipoprotein-sorting protein
MLIFFYLNVSFSTENKEKHKEDVYNYFQKINEFESNFLQIQDGEVKNGQLFKKNNRLKILYSGPPEIILVLKRNRGMYYNKDLEEVEYFGTKNNNSKIFFDLFNDSHFFDDAVLTNSLNNFSFTKIINIQNEKIKIKIFFEDSPVLLKKIEVHKEDEFLNFYIDNINLYPQLEEDFFSLAHPLLN